MARHAKACLRWVRRIAKSYADSVVVRVKRENDECEKSGHASRSSETLKAARTGSGVDVKRPDTGPSESLKRAHKMEPTSEPSKGMSANTKAKKRRSSPKSSPSVKVESERCTGFFLSDENTRLRFFCHRLHSFNQMFLKKIAEILISCLVQKKRTRFPYTTNKREGVPPPFHPTSISPWSRGPHHLQKPNLVPLVLFLLRLHWNVDLFVEMNDNETHTGLEKLLACGWSTFIETMLLSLENFKFAENRRTASRQDHMSCLGQVLWILRLELDFLQGREAGTRWIAVPEMNLPHYEVLKDCEQLFHKTPGAAPTLSGFSGSHENQLRYHPLLSAAKRCKAESTEDAVSTDDTWSPGPDTPSSAELIGIGDLAVTDSNPELLDIEQLFPWSSNLFGEYKGDDSVAETLLRAQKEKKRLVSEADRDLVNQSSVSTSFLGDAKQEDTAPTSSTGDLSYDTAPEAGYFGTDQFSLPNQMPYHPPLTPMPSCLNNAGPMCHSGNEAQPWVNFNNNVGIGNITPSVPLNFPPHRGFDIRYSTPVMNGYGYQPFTGTLSPVPYGFEPHVPATPLPNTPMFGLNSTCAFPQHFEQAGSMPAQPQALLSTPRPAERNHSARPHRRRRV